MSNYRQPLLITRAEITASNVVNEDKPILIVHDAKPGQRSTTSGSYERHYPLAFYNVSWGLVRTPVLEFSIVRDADVEQAATGPFQHTMKGRTFDGDIDFDLDDYIDSNMPRERITTKAAVYDVLSRAGAVNVAEDREFIEYLDVVGRLSFLTERREPRSVNFRAKVYFTGFGPGRVNPSYKYNVPLPDDQQGFPLTIPLSQCVAGNSADNFLMAFQSRRSTSYDLKIDLLSTDGVILSKSVVLHTLVSRNYGLVRPAQTGIFSVKEGCT